jgi:hypothetical protein
MKRKQGAKKMNEGNKERKEKCRKIVKGKGKCKFVPVLH